MNKVELVKAIAAKTGVTQKAVKETLEAMQEVVYETVKTEDVKIFEGTTLYVKKIDEAVKRNPSNGEPVTVPAHNVIKCKFGKVAKDAVK